jgi:hypothetical protein
VEPRRASVGPASVTARGGGRCDGDGLGPCRKNAARDTKECHAGKGDCVSPRGRLAGGVQVRAEQRVEEVGFQSGALGGEEVGAKRSYSATSRSARGPRLMMECSYAI